MADVTNTRPALIVPQALGEWAVLGVSAIICIVVPTVFWLAVVQIALTLAGAAVPAWVVPAVTLGALVILTPIWGSLCASRIAARRHEE